MLLLSLLLAGNFWNDKPPEQWTVAEVRTLLTNSPWGQSGNSANEVEVHLATALPMKEAEKRERAFARRTGAMSLTFDEYTAMAEEGRYIVLAVKIEDPLALSDNDHVKRLERDSEMRVANRRFKIVTYFPPTPGDPYMRLVFSRVPLAGALVFRIYVPGAISPYRNAEFNEKDLFYKGKVEY